MAPTVEVDTSSSSSASTASSPSERVRGRYSAAETESYLARPNRSPVEMLAFTLDDCDNTCETYFCSKDVTPSTRTVIPEPSPAFREAMGKLKLERTNETSLSSEKKNNAILSSTSSVPSSTPSKSKSSSSTSSSLLSSSSSSSSSSASSSSPSSSASTHLSPNYAESGSAKSSNAAAKSGNARRPASFGGADHVKPRTNRRASHCEKRVSWADERGSDHQLISVRLIRPRLGKEVNTRKQSAPGHSILRNTGTY